MRWLFSGESAIVESLHAERPDVTAAMALADPKSVDRRQLLEAVYAIRRHLGLSPPASKPLAAARHAIHDGTFCGANPGIEDRRTHLSEQC